ncbi:unnamed protein product [Phytomonas sp. Hart1]|nr:unnamed protein product [Phytomonas sp. Hart1]|eukprot:CCW69946.1 unnamed protein product [Phytomonas sp. isolate Hart1]
MESYHRLKIEFNALSQLFPLICLGFQERVVCSEFSSMLSVNTLLTDISVLCGEILSFSIIPGETYGCDTFCRNVNSAVILVEKTRVKWQKFLAERKAIHDTAARLALHLRSSKHSVEPLLSQQASVVDILVVSLSRIVYLEENVAFAMERFYNPTFGISAIEQPASDLETHLRQQLNNSEKECKNQQKHIIELENQLCLISNFLSNLAASLMPSINIEKNLETCLPMLLFAAAEKVKCVERLQKDLLSMQVERDKYITEGHIGKTRINELEAAVREGSFVVEDLKQELIVQQRQSESLSVALKRIAQFLDIPFEEGVVVVSDLLATAACAKIDKIYQDMEELKESVNNTSAVPLRELEANQEVLKQLKDQRQQLTDSEKGLLQRIRQLLNVHSDIFKDDFRTITTLEGVGDALQCCFEKIEAFECDRKRSRERIDAFEEKNKRLAEEITAKDDKLSEKTEQNRNLLQKLQELCAAREFSSDDGQNHKIAFQHVQKQLRALLEQACERVEELWGQLPVLHNDTVYDSIEGIRYLITFISQKFVELPSREELEHLQQSLKTAGDCTSFESTQKGQMQAAYVEGILPFLNTQELLDGAAVDSLTLTPALITRTGRQLSRAAGHLQKGLNALGTLPPGLRPIATGESPLHPSNSLVEGAERLAATAAEFFSHFANAEEVFQILSILAGVPIISLAADSREWERWTSRIRALLCEGQRSAEALASSEAALAEFIQTVVALVCEYGGQLPPISMTERSSLISFSPEKDRERVVEALSSLLDEMQEREGGAVEKLQAASQTLRQVEEEQREAEDVILELRRRVQQKTLEDDFLEANLRAFDDALAMQSQELAMRYQKDQDIILRRFSEMRDKVRRILHRSSVSRHSHSHSHSQRMNAMR